MDTCSSFGEGSGSRPPGVRPPGTLADGRMYGVYKQNKDCQLGRSTGLLATVLPAGHPGAFGPSVRAECACWPSLNSLCQDARMGWGAVREAREWASMRSSPASAGRRRRREIEASAPPQVQISRAEASHADGSAQLCEPGRQERRRDKTLCLDGGSSVPGSLRRSVAALHGDERSSRRREAPLSRPGGGRIAQGRCEGGPRGARQRQPALNSRIDEEVPHAERIPTVPLAGKCD